MGPGVPSGVAMIGEEERRSRPSRSYLVGGGVVGGPWWVGGVDGSKLVGWMESGVWVHVVIVIVIVIVPAVVDRLHPCSVV